MNVAFLDGSKTSFICTQGYQMQLAEFGAHLFMQILGVKAGNVGSGF